LHPDSRNTVSDEVLARAFIAFNALEYALTGKQSAVKQPLVSGGPYATLNDLWKRGWTRTLVDELLSPPDRTARAVPSGRSVPRYGLARVKETEAGDTFKRGRKQPPRALL
jgi:hypothetical protein